MMRFGWANSLFGGFLISLCCPCCFLQVFLNLFGIGCAGLNTLLVPYRPLFVSLTVISLTYSYIRYRPSKTHFTMMVMLTLCLSLSPEIFQMFRKESVTNVQLGDDNQMMITHWKIVGMHCESCRSTVVRAFGKIDGILDAHVDLEMGQADVTAHVHIEDDVIIQAIQSEGFQIYKII
ncbi:unnamed protein product [Adineta ricciae]|uniref:HMA domain-containing protein n=1 Tax=Adineta ricciae TaxID=249248 RepID=A0A813MI24_ADIRI|nr:unnamed protein product [Adineta ricciae]CAF0785320.1 unnamed protein product [Adineta ricciae]